jgi:putative N-acetylmannosamine-6-phosphate epimerase
MTLAELRGLLNEAALIASVQAPAGSPLDSPDHIVAMAKASLAQGVKVLRLQGVANINAVRESCPGVPIIGLIKRDFGDSPVYITPTSREVQELIEVGCEVVALDATTRHRPGGETLSALVQSIRSSGCIAMGDCDSLDSAKFAQEAGCEILSSTLSGYTAESSGQSGPDLPLIRAMRQQSAEVIVLAEGRYEAPWQLGAALASGADGIVMGGALNDPLKNTTKFLAATKRWSQPVAAFDLGGTWLRYAHVSALGEIIRSERIPLPDTHEERLDWMAAQAQSDGVCAAGISAGGVIVEGKVASAKGFIPDYVGRSLDLSDHGIHTVAINDGLATGWGHARYAPWVGGRVATLALGTGVGAGIADAEEIFTTDGDYPRLNDLLTPEGQTVEDLLGGMNLGDDPTQADREPLLLALKVAAEAVKIAAPDVVVLCGGVGLSPTFRQDFLDLLSGMGLRAEFTPYGAEAGLVGAATLVLDPPRQFRATVLSWLE